MSLLSAICMNVILASDTTLASQAIAGFVGAAVGALATVVVVFLTPLAQRRDRYDSVILERRMKAYEGLWAVLHPTSRQSEASGDHLDVKDLEDRLTAWYYDNGQGLYMTADLRQLFFSFRASLPRNDRHAVGDEASALRTQMARDISSRRPPLLPKERLNDT
jgi:hypothetical protein